MSRGRYPTEKQLRKHMNLQPSSKFLGWAVHLPGTDEFLAVHTAGPDAMLTAWTQGPKAARLFTSAPAAGAIVTRQSRPAVLVAIFDVGADLAVIEVAGNQHSRFAD
jgi:hypothetical protein